jgi:cell wall-associated NlpC family hydrolase
VSDADYFTNVSGIRSIIAADIISTANNVTTVALTGDFLAHQTAEVTYNSYYNAPDTLTLTLVDPDWQIQCSGLCNKDPDGLLPLADFNFPAGTDVWWRLDDVSNTSGDLSTAGLQLIFQHRIASYLQEDWGPLKIAPGSTTRAQFVKQMCDRIPKALDASVIGPGSQRSQSIQFVCPELNVIQPLVGATTGTTTTDHTTVKNKTAQVNKSKAIGYGVSNLTVKGTKITRSQIDVVNAGLQAADALNAPEVVMVALMYAGMGESSLGADAGDSENVWQANNPGNYGPSPNWTEMATAFLQGTKDFETPGAIKFASTYADAWQIANATEGNKVWNQSQTDSYGHEWSGGQAQGITEAQHLVAAYGGSTGGSSGSSTTTSVTSDVGELKRGSTDNPDEDSLTCIQSLASGVNWEFYISAHPSEGEWGNYAYFMSGPTNNAQMPSAYLTRSTTNPGTWDLSASLKTATMTTVNCLNQQPTYTVDNTAFTYQTTKTRHGKVQRAVKTVKPQSPTQIQIDLVCAPMSYAAGDVFVFANSGPINGRWIVSETERNFIEDPFDQITLVPPTAPDPEPTVTTATSTTTSGGVSGSSSAGSGTLAKAVNLATRAAALEAEQHCYTYTELAGRTNDGNGVLSSPFTFDCSGFCGAVYNFAGLGAPYGPDGYTGTTKDVQANMTQISQDKAVPGDLVLFGPDASSPVHVVVNIGNGQCVSMGQQGEPEIMAIQSEIDSLGFIGYFHLASAT